MAPFLDKTAQDRAQAAQPFPVGGAAGGHRGLLALAAAHCLGACRRRHDGADARQPCSRLLRASRPRPSCGSIGPRPCRATTASSRASSTCWPTAPSSKRRPVLYVIPSMTLNAFAAGSPEHSAIAVTEGLLRRLSLSEISGVLAHEMSHIRNNDLWVMGLADVVTRFLQLLSYVALGLAVFNVLAALSGDDTISWWADPAALSGPGPLEPACSSAFRARASSTPMLEAARAHRRSRGARLGSAAARDRHRPLLGGSDVPGARPARAAPSLLRSHPATEDRVDRLVVAQRTADSSSRSSSSSSR